MLNTVLRLEVYEKTSGESDHDAIFATTPYIVEDLMTVTTMFGIEQIKDSVKFTVPIENIPNSIAMEYKIGDYNIKIGDLVKLYAYNAPMTGTLEDNLIMITFIKNWNFSSAQGNGTVSFTTYSRSEILLNNFIFITENTGEKVPNMLVAAVTKIKSFNTVNPIIAYKDYSGLSTPGRKGAYDEDGVIVSGKFGYIRAYKDAAYDSDGNLLSSLTSNVPTTLDAEGNSLYYFDDAIFVENYKSFVDHLDDLSTTKYTGDINKGAYIYYVDNDGNLHWKPKRFVTTSSRDSGELILNEIEGSALTLNKDMNDIVNAVIVNCGTDPNEVGVLTFAFDASSMGKNGAKWKYVGKTDIGEGVRQDEIKSGTYTLDDGQIINDGVNAPAYIGEDNYPSSYPWTIQTSGTDEFIPPSFSYIGGSTEVNSASEYRKYFRDVSKALGKIAGNNIIAYGSEPIYKGSYELEIGTNDYVAGDLTKVVAPSIGILESNNIKVRIMSVAHNFQGGIWSTTLDLKEDRDLELV